MSLRDFVCLLVISSVSPRDVHKKRMIFRCAASDRRGSVQRIVLSTPFRVAPLTAVVQVAPFSKSGGLADVCDKLGVALSRQGHRCMPSHN